MKYLIIIIILIAIVTVFVLSLPKNHAILDNSEITSDPTPTLPAKKTGTPYPQASEIQEIFCGGIMGKLCPTGYTCKLDGDYPDAGGSCIPLQ